MNCTIIDKNVQQQLIETIERAAPRPHHSALLLGLEKVLPECPFRYVLSKSGWHRSGGVLNAKGEHLSDDLESWAAEELSKYDNFELLVDQYIGKGLLATRHMGRTLYFTAAYGNAPEDFLQLEVEELQEIQDRELFLEEQLPTDYQELVEPINRVKVESHAVSSPKYRFVRIVNIREVVEQQDAHCDGVSPLSRFMSDWSESRAADYGHFSEHWLIANLERYSPDGSTPFTASPMSVDARTLRPFQWNLTKSGVELAEQIHNYDRAAGYPGAWYFQFVGSKLVSETLIQSLQQDLDNGFYYLGDKEINLLQKLIANPYHATA